MQELVDISQLPDEAAQRSPRETAHSYTIPSGVRGTEDTIKQMIPLVQEGKRDPVIIKLARRLIGSCPQKDWMCYAKALHNYTCHDIHYCYDPNGVETISSARFIVESGAGDCDDKCTLFPALCEAIGLACRFVTVKAPGSNEYTHIFCQVLVPRKGWIDSDCTMPNKPFGWGPGPEYTRKTWLITPDGERHGGDSMNGLGCDECGGTCGQSLSGIFGSCDDDSTLSGLGETDTPQATMLEILNGTAYTRLRAAKDENYSQIPIIQRNLSSAVTPQQKQVAQAAADSNLKARQSLQEAINKYSSIVGWIQTFGGKRWAPQQLASLGIFGIDDATEAIAVLVAAGVVIVPTLYALGYAVNAFFGHNQETKGFIAQFADLGNSAAATIQSSGNAIQSVGKSFESLGTGLATSQDAILKIGIITLIGLAGYVGFRALQRKGHA